MDDLFLAWRNVWRNPRRSILTMLAVAFSSTLLVFMLSFQFGSYEDMINASVKLNTGHLQVQAKGYIDKKEMRKVVPDPGDVIAALEKLPGITGISPRGEAFALAAGARRTRGVMVMGVNPDREKEVSTLPGQIRKGEYLKKGDHNVAVIGTLLAERLRVGLGDELTLLGQARDGSVAATIVTVTGIYRAGIDAFDRSTLQIPLTDFDEVFAMEGAVHSVVVAVDRLRTAGRVGKTARTLPALAGLSVLGWEEIMPGLKQSIQMDLVSGIIMYLVLIIVVAFSILNTFLMSIFERTREFGVLMAIGTRPGRLVRMMLAESMLMTSLGLGLGMLLGAGITLCFSVYGINLGGAGEILAEFGISGRLYPRLSLISLFSGPLLVLVITFFTALYPALRIPGLKPVEALRAA